MSHDLISVARSWLGTPFKHQGRKKQVGCDCIGLVVGVLEEAGVCFDGKRPMELDQTDYNMQPDGKRLKAALLCYLKPVEITQMQAGDIVLMRFEKEPQHVGVIGSCELSEIPDQVRDDRVLFMPQHLTLIHCYQGVGKVVEHHLDEKWWRRIVGVYRVW